MQVWLLPPYAITLIQSVSVLLGTEYLALVSIIIITFEITLTITSFIFTSSNFHEFYLSFTEKKHKNLN